MVWRLAAAAVLSMILAGTALADGPADRHGLDTAFCKRYLGNGRFKTHMEFAKCVNRANAKYWQAAGLPNVDLVEYAASREIVAAEKFDAGRMSEAEYAAARAGIKSDLLSALKQRDAASAIIHTPTPVYAPEPRGPVTCYTTGHITNCF